MMDSVRHAWQRSEAAHECSAVSAHGETTTERDGVGKSANHEDDDTVMTTLVRLLASTTATTDDDQRIKKSSFSSDNNNNKNKKKNNNEEEYSNDGESFPQGCLFSPDGSCLLTARCHTLELYNTPSMLREDTDDDHDDDATTTTTTTMTWNPVLTYATGDTVRSYQWYPHMTSRDPATACFVSCSRHQPVVHLWDAYQADTIRATYCPTNPRTQEGMTPACLRFVQNGTQLVTGGFQTERMVQLFDISRPGKHPFLTLHLGRTRRSKDGQKGFVSALDYQESEGLLAVGTFAPGSIYLYDLRAHARAPVSEIVATNSVCVSGHGRLKAKGLKKKRKLDKVEKNDNDDDDDDDGTEEDLLDFSAAKQQWYHNRTRGGVTQLKFWNDGHSSSSSPYLLSASRRSNAILQYDLRRVSSLSTTTVGAGHRHFCPGVASYETDNDTNQRIEFQVVSDAKRNGMVAPPQLWTGGRDGYVRCYDLSLKTDHHCHHSSEHAQFQQHFGSTGCVVNGISIHGGNPHNQGQGDDTLLAVAMGTRHFPSENDWDEDDPHASMKKRCSSSTSSSSSSSSSSSPRGSLQVHQLTSRRSA